MQNTVKITRTKSYFPDVKKKIRIVTFSDLHFSKKMKIERMTSLLNLVSNWEPNYIFWLGDNLDDTNVLEDYDRREDFLSICKKSGMVAPTAISLSDHDMRYRMGEHIVEDFDQDLWQEIDSMGNVHVLNNSAYEDEHLRVVGYTMPTYYFHRAYPLPKDSLCSSVRKDEDVYVLIEDLRKNQGLFTPVKGKVNELLFHSPLTLKNDTVQNLLSGFEHVHSGHMHEGLTPPILDEIAPKTLGMISPQRTLFPKNAKGCFQTRYGTLCIISGGITKIAESQKAILQPLNHVFPIHIDILDVEQGEKVKQYKREYYYQSLN